MAIFHGLIEKPRPMPRRMLPTVAAGAAVLLALPVYALLGWSLKGWALGAVLFLASQGIALLLGRLTPGVDNLGASSVMGFGMMFRAIVVMLVIIAVASQNKSVGLAAAGVYALAYTMELGISLTTYFSAPVEEPAER
jgi:hypothetical protein